MKTGIHFVPSLMVAALVVSTAARGAVFSSQADLNQSLIYAQSPWFNSVVQTTVTHSGGTSYGSGVVFQYNNWVALSGHQLTKNSISSVQFNVRSPYGSILETAVADNWYIADWTATSTVGSGLDFALAHLSTPLSVTPAEPYYSPRSCPEVRSLRLATQGVECTCKTPKDGSLPELQTSTLLVGIMDMATSAARSVSERFVSLLSRPCPNQARWPYLHLEWRLWSSLDESECDSARQSEESLSTVRTELERAALVE